MKDESTLPPDETLASVAARIEAWIGLGVPGIVWLRHTSDSGRDRLLSRLRQTRPVPSIPFDPPTAESAAGWLEDALESAIRENGPLAVIVLFPPALHGSADHLLQAFASLNQRREAIARQPVVQLWCVPAGIAALAAQAAPDLASWFQIRLTLSEVFPIPGAFEPGSSGNEDLESIRRAVERSRAMAKMDPQTFLPAVAGRLADLSRGLRYAGRSSGALESAEESVAIFRQLTGSHRDAFLGDLAQALSILAVAQCEVGRWAEAQSSIEESIAYLSQLSEVNPHTFGPRLETSLAVSEAMREAARHRRSA